MEQADVPQLLISREEARERIEARCELGRTLYGKYMIESASDADGVYKSAMLKSDFRLWDALNIRVLRDMFTTPYSADEYNTMNTEHTREILEAKSAIEEKESRIMTWKYRFGEVREELIGKRLRYLMSLGERLDLVEES
jgi:hypothetical protein